MADAEAISNLLKQLAIYRGNIQHLLLQAAQHGGERYAPLDLMNNIRIQRASIAQTKTLLRASGVSVEDQPSDSLVAEGDNPIDPRDRRLAIRFEQVLDRISGQLAVFFVQHQFTDAMRITLADYSDIPNTNYPEPGLVEAHVSVFVRNSLKAPSSVLVNNRRLSWAEVLIDAFAHTAAECDRLRTQHAERDVILLSCVDDLHDRSEMLATTINIFSHTPELSASYETGIPESHIVWYQYYLLTIIKSYRVIRQFQ